MSDKQLGPTSPINEIFEMVTPDEGMRVLPTEIPAPEGKKHLAILITGSAAEANVMMANLMAYVADMQAVAEQKAAESQILGTDGKPVEDEPAIIVP